MCPTPLTTVLGYRKVLYIRSNNIKARKIKVMLLLSKLIMSNQRKGQVRVRTFMLCDFFIRLLGLMPAVHLRHPSDKSL